MQLEVLIEQLNQSHACHPSCREREVVYTLGRYGKRSIHAAELPHFPNPVKKRANEELQVEVIGFYHT
ncbi:MAG: hypothetical protein NZM11_06650, partial [Anaerolineales bacterium]|nr:hypothetical protein [Anaerolineales bacterium]